MSKKLDKIRFEIDKIDSKIIEILNKRANLSINIGKLKKERKKGGSVYVPYREMEVYKKIKNKNKGPLKENTLQAIYREIMSGSLSLEHPMRVAFLGPHLTFTHSAAIKKFGSSIEYSKCANISDVFSEVSSERCDYGVIPIENSTEGAVNHALDMFVDSDLKIFSEVYLKISHNLLSTSGNLKSIRKIYSKDQVFAQCRKWIEINLPKAELVEVSSTSRAAQLIKRQKNVAAIASLLAAKEYGLKVLAKSIEDFDNNTTRFLVIGRDVDLRSSGNDKTSILVSLKDKVGALHDLLTVFKRKSINLTKIESRPSKVKAWQYYFFIDLEGHFNDKKVREALGQLEKNTSFIKILGSYPSARS